MGAQEQLEEYVSHGTRIVKIMTQNSDRGSILCKHSCLEVSKIPSTSRTHFIMVFSNLDIFLFLILKPNLELVCSRENFVNLLHNTIINLTNLFMFWKIKWLLNGTDHFVISCEFFFCYCAHVISVCVARTLVCSASCDDQKKFANVGWLANSYWRRKNSPSFLAMIAFKKTSVHPPSI